MQLSKIKTSRISNLQSVTLQFPADITFSIDNKNIFVQFYEEYWISL